MLLETGFQELTPPPPPETLWGDFSLASSGRRRWRLYELLSCQEFILPPLSTGTESGDQNYVMSLQLPRVGLWVGVSRPVGTSRFTRSELGEWRVRTAHVWEWGPYRPGLPPHHVAYCGERWQDLPYYIQGNGIWINRPSTRRSLGADPEVWWRIGGIRDISIPVIQDMYH